MWDKILIGLFWTSDPLVAVAATYNTDNKRNWQKSMPSHRIRNLDSISQAASELHVKPHGHQDRQGIITVQLFICCFIFILLLYFLFEKRNYLVLDSFNSTFSGLGYFRNFKLLA